MIDVVQYRFISGHKSQRQGAGEDTFSGLFNDSFMFNPYNRSESILLYTLNRTSGVWMANLLHSPMEHVNLSFFTIIYHSAGKRDRGKRHPREEGAKPPDSIEQGEKPPVR